MTMRLGYFWFVVAGISVVCMILFPIFHLGHNWMLDVAAGVVVILTGFLWYAARNRKRFDLRLRLIVAGNLIGVIGILSWGNIGQNLVYVGLAFWLAAYLLLRMRPNKGLHGGYAEGRKGTTSD